MLRRFILVTVCLLVVAGCAKKPSPTGGTVMGSGEIAFFYAPGWVVNKLNDGTWRFEHPSATAWGAVQVLDEQNKTDDVAAYLERMIEKEWGDCTVVKTDSVEIQGRSVRRSRYMLHYYMKRFSACGMYYGGPEGTVVVVTYVMSDQEWAIQKDMDNFMKGIAFKR